MPDIYLRLKEKYAEDYIYIFWIDAFKGTRSGEFYNVLNFSNHYIHTNA